MVNGNSLGKGILMLQAKLSAHLNQHSTYSFRELCRLVKAQNLAIYTAMENYDYQLIWEESNLEVPVEMVDPL